MAAKIKRTPKDSANINRFLFCRFVGLFESIVKSMSLAQKKASGSQCMKARVHQHHSLDRLIHN